MIDPLNQALVGPAGLLSTLPASDAMAVRANYQMVKRANTTMETYEQGPTSAVPSCFGCHNDAPRTPLAVSHIAWLTLPPKTAAP